MTSSDRREHGAQFFGGMAIHVSLVPIHAWFTRMKSGSIPGVFETAANGLFAISVMPGQFPLKGVGPFAASPWAPGGPLAQEKACEEPR